MVNPDLHVRFPHLTPIGSHQPGQNLRICGAHLAGGYAARVEGEIPKQAEALVGRNAGQSGSRIDRFLEIGVGQQVVNELTFRDAQTLRMAAEHSPQHGGSTPLTATDEQWSHCGTGLGVSTMERLHSRFSWTLPLEYACAPSWLPHCPCCLLVPCRPSPCGTASRICSSSVPA